MSSNHPEPNPDFWLVFVPEEDMAAPDEILAVASDVAELMANPNAQYPDHVRGLISYARACREAWCPESKVIFAGEVTRWLDGQGKQWSDTPVHFFEALEDLMRFCTRMFLSVSDVAYDMVAGMSAHESFMHYSDGTSENVTGRREELREKVEEVLMRDYPPFIASL